LLLPSPELLGFRGPRMCFRPVRSPKLTSCNEVLPFSCSCCILRARAASFAFASVLSFFKRKLREHTHAISPGKMIAGTSLRATQRNRDATTEVQPHAITRGAHARLASLVSTVLTDLLTSFASAIHVGTSGNATRITMRVMNTPCSTNMAYTHSGATSNRIMIPLPQSNKHIAGQPVS
jgi:hypothetical protein